MRDSTFHFPWLIQAARKRVAGYAGKVVFASASGYAMDGFDLLILGFGLAAIASSMGVVLAEARALTTLTLWGAVVGGIGFGALADRLGRVKTPSWPIMLFAVFAGLSALAWNIRSISFFRLVAGMGLGGEFGIGMTLAAEAWPARKGARAGGRRVAGRRVIPECGGAAFG